MGRSRKEPEYKPHPQLEKLRPRLKPSARRSLLKSMEKVGQLSEILVTADGYILDGRSRLELAYELGAQPRVRHLSMHSCVGDMPPGYDREWEMEQVLDVIEETGRSKWRDGAQRRQTPELGESEDNPELGEGDSNSELAACSVLDRLLRQSVSQENPLGVRLDPWLRCYLDQKASKTGARGTASYVRRLCIQDYLEHPGEGE